MQTHQIPQPKGSHKRRKIVGRGKGSGSGKTSGRGHGRNQGARSGRGIIPQLEGGQMPLLRRTPKIGFRRKNPLLYQEVSLEALAKFKAGAVVDAIGLRQKGLIENPYKPFKILGDGEIKNALTVRAYAFSKSAEEKITKAGGKAEVVDKKALIIEVKKSAKK
ncbi:MAG: 50S ribosomal protein L15 [Candidatus Omnitrophica bacterium]|nr:50S ribosomal protein L15 [Candidatus Omnitrophota bacterium]